MSRLGWWLAHLFPHRWIRLFSSGWHYCPVGDACERPACVESRALFVTGLVVRSDRLARALADFDRGEQ